MPTLPPNIVRWLTLISGLLAIVIPNLSVVHLPAGVQGTITGVGGFMLIVLAYLEHPTTQTAAQQKGTNTK